MKRRKIKKIIGISIVFVLILLGLSRMNRCGNNSPNRGIPYDKFSRAIYREMGDDIWYYYKDKGRSGEKEYYYIIEKCDRDTITRFSKVLNDLAQEEKKKIAIYVEVENTHGSESVLSLKNYSTIIPNRQTMKVFMHFQYHILRIQKRKDLRTHKHIQE